MAEAVKDLATVLPTSTIASASDVTAAQADLTVPLADASANAEVTDVVGNKEDAAAYAISTEKSIMSYVKGIIGRLAVTAADDTNNYGVTSTVGNKEDSAQTVVGTTHSLMAYSKGILNALAALQFLSAEEKAVARIEKFGTYPLLEDFSRLENADPRYVANTALTGEISLMSARFPGAVGWTYKVSDGSSALVVTDNTKYLQLSAGGALHRQGVIAAWPVLLAGPGASWTANDERLIFEVLLAPDSDNANGNVCGIFFGLASGVDIESDFTCTHNMEDKTIASNRRVGFVMNGTADKQMVGLCSNGVTVSTTGPFTATVNAPQHFKFVYDIGTQVEFFYNGISQGVVTTNLPGMAITDPQHFYPFFLKRALTTGAGSMRLFGCRAYFQNGV